MAKKNSVSSVGAHRGDNMDMARMSKADRLKVIKKNQAKLKKKQGKEEAKAE